MCNLYKWSRQICLPSWFWLLKTSEEPYIHSIGWVWVCESVIDAGWATELLCRPCCLLGVDVNWGQAGDCYMHCQEFNVSVQDTTHPYFQACCQQDRGTSGTECIPQETRLLSGYYRGITRGELVNKQIEKCQPETNNFATCIYLTVQQLLFLDGNGWISCHA